MYTILTVTFSEYLRQRMAELNLNNKGVAALAGVVPSVVGDWLKGTLPRAETLIQLANGLRDDPRYLFNIVYGLPLPDTSAEREADVEAILRKIAAMPEEQRRQAEKYIDFLLQEARKNQDAEV